MKITKSANRIKMLVKEIALVSVVLVFSILETRIIFNSSFFFYEFWGHFPNFSILDLIPKNYKEEKSSERLMR